MQNNNEQETTNTRGFSRRDFLKLCSLTFGVFALPRAYTRTIEQAQIEQAFAAPRFYFQWQNEFLCKTIYPMREAKLRDFLTYYMEVDVWSQYKNKNINTLTNEVSAYKKDWEVKASAALKEYTALRDYFLNKSVRGYYYKFQPLDEAELTEINNFHTSIVQSWPKDIRNERATVQDFILKWTEHRDVVIDWINGRERRHKAMDPSHPSYILEGEELKFKKNITLPMVEREMAQLLAFLATYDKIEKRKLDWFNLSLRDPNYKVPEADFLTKFPPEQEVTLRDLAYMKIEDYTKSIATKNQYELLDLINQRFQREPKRFPQWLQYMVVHFSGMRYASAHGSWADPKDLIIRLQVLDVERELTALDDSGIEKRCREKAAVYESTGWTNKPKLALATEKEWVDKISLNLTIIKAVDPKTRRAGLVALQTDEITYEIRSLSTDEALMILKEMKSIFPKWAWKEIVKLTTLRVTEVTDLEWEKLTAQEEQDRNSQQSNDSRAVMDAWENYDVTGWREEHGRTHELIVTRGVCNEIAEHAQHIRGYLPPGGLAARPPWYLANETEGKLPGAYYVRPGSEKDFTQGASILWLRFVNEEPNEWQIATWIETKQKVGLLPDEFKTRTGQAGEWQYTLGDVITRSRTVVTPDNRTVNEKEWLRWIHESTVAEVAETADGVMVIAFETSLPDNKIGVSAVGMFKKPLDWHIADGTEDQYNRSFVGYVPEGQAPVEHMKTMLDWNRIFNKAVV